MDSASLAFLAFGLLAALASNLHPSPRWRGAVLFAASLYLLLVLSPRLIMLAPLAGFLAFGYAAVLMARRFRGRSTALALPLLVFVYVWLKKYTFLPPSIFLTAPYLALGLSYIFFRVIHLVTESSGGAIQQPVSPVRYLLYTLGFPTLVAGPIQGYDEFARDQFAAQPVSLDIATVARQLERILRGYFKVGVVAMLISDVRLDALAQLTHPSASLSARLTAALTLSAAYPFFLYCNFSGYIDIVIALARLMRLRLPENFDRPFSATNVFEFWNRWHITLSRWLKNYVYNPLTVAAMRRINHVGWQTAFGIFNLLITFFLIGIWHGRTSEFAVFGLLQGSGVAVHKLWQLRLERRLGRKGYRALGANALYRTLARGLNLTWFAFTLFWFWADWPKLSGAYRALGPGWWLAVFLTLWMLFAIALEAWERLRSLLLAIGCSRGGPLLLHAYARAAYAGAFAVLAWIVTVYLTQPAPEVVYKAF